MKGIVRFAMAAVAFMVMAGVLVAQEEAKQVTVVTGKVVVTKDADGAVTAVKIMTEAGKEVAVKLDEQGKKLAEMADAQVTATGTMVEGMLVVEKCAKVEAKAPAAPAEEK